MKPAWDRSITAATLDAQAAVREFDRAREWLTDAGVDLATPLAVEVWVFDTDLTSVLLVNHRWRGWVPPGGRVEPGEAPRAAAVREVFEETGLRVELLARPAAVAVRSYRHGWAPTLGLSYAAITDASIPVSGEAGQPVAWTELGTSWESTFPDDSARMSWQARWIALHGTA